MFSPLARGKASWDGDLQCETYSDQTSPIEPLLPHLINHSSSRNKSARSSGSLLLEDGQLALPKTFVTRKGAILLFTPSDEVCNHSNEESHFKKENVFEAGLKLRTVGNLTNSVLEFGKEEEEAWEGVSDYPKEASEKGEQPKRDKASFLRFLHYLDSENLTADKNVQPGADPDYYLEELKKARGQNSHRRFRSQTPFSTRTSYSTNTASHYSHFLDDDDEITGIIQEYMKYGKPAGWSHSKEHLEHRIVSSDHMPDIGMEGRETLEDFSHFSSPGSPRTNRGNTITFSPSMPSMAFGFATHEAQDSISRPKTAPIPPTLESSRANPRITSGKPPPLPRALGSTPNHLDEIINADVGFGRFHRRGPNPRMRLSRSPSPSFQLGSSRGTTPDFATKVQRLAASPDGKTEEWNRTANVIEEEDEAPSQFDQTETGKRSRRPSSAASPRSGREEKVGIQRRASSAGTTNRIARSSLHSSRSASYSSVSHYNRGQSARSRDVERVGSSPDLAETDRDEASPTWPSVRDDFFILQDDMADHVDGHPTGRVSGDTTHSEMSSQARDKLVKSPSPPPRSPSVTSRVASASPRSPSVQSRHETIAKSRGSSAISSSTSEQWQDAIKAAAEEDGRKSSSSVRERHIRSRQSGPAEEEDAQDGTDIDTRTSSAKTAQEGTETRATLGSEADLAQVSETIVRSQPVVEGVYEYLLPEEETADQEWPCISEGGEFDWPDETIESDDKNGIAEELTISTRDGPPEKEFPSALPVNTKGSSDPGPAQPETLTEATELEEEQQETPTIEVHKDEALTSVPSLLKPHESETTPSSIETQELKETETVVVQSSQPVEKFIADTAIHDDGIAVVQDSALPSRVKEVKDSLLSVPEKPTSTPATVPRSSSPAPIKAEQILHKELLPEARLELVGEVDDNRPPSPYKETIDIEKSRPSSPITEDQRSVPVSIGEAVRNYIESGQEPQIRDRSTRSRRGSETGAEEKDIEAKAVEKSSLSSMEKEAMSPTKPEAVKPKINKQSKPISSNVIEKPFGKNKAESKPDHSELNLLKSDDKAKEVKEPTDEEREARRQIVSSLLNKHDAPRDGKLELEGIGKEGEGIDSSSGGLVTRTSPLVAEKKNDLSDLAALVNKNKTPSKLKERKADSKKKSGKHGKFAKKKDEITVDPENIDFEAFNTPDMLDGMDDELRQFIQEQSKATSATDNQPSSSASAVNYTKTRKESVQTLDMPQVALEVPLDKKDAHAPSKPIKLTKKELAKIRADQRKEERKKKDEEKRMREEEMRLLKEREEEAALAKAEAEEKQRNIEEEKMKRLVEEEEAKQQEQEALERLKEAKKKAREERELRRAAEAERRRLEVQKKREEKKKREEELREREKELEQQKMNREKRMAEIEEARRRKEEMERLEEEQRREEERLLELQREEEERMLEEEKIREAEEELRRLQEEREYREQMRRIAEMQEAKLRQEEEERLRREEAERQRAEDEKRGREEAEQERLREEQRRIEMARRLEALARMRSAQAAARRKALLLKRREDNVERMQSLKHTRCGQGITRTFVFTYYTHIPRKIWEVPIGFTKKKKGFGSPRRKPAPPKPP